MLTDTVVTVMVLLVAAGLFRKALELGPAPTVPESGPVPSRLWLVRLAPGTLVLLCLSPIIRNFLGKIFANPTTVAMPVALGCGFLGVRAWQANQSTQEGGDIEVELGEGNKRFYIQNATPGLLLILMGTAIGVFSLYVELQHRSLDHEGEMERAKVMGKFLKESGAFDSRRRTD